MSGFGVALAPMTSSAMRSDAMKHLSRIFPRHERRIVELRATDPEFEEICSDFEILAEDMTNCERRGHNDEKAGFAPRQADIRASLAGLEDEIRTILRKHYPND